MEQYEIDNSAISASKKRLEQINLRLPEIQTEIVQINQARTGIDTELEKIKVFIDQINLKKNNINKDLQIIESQRNKILTEQSQAAAKKSEIDNKIKSLHQSTK